MSPLRVMFVSWFLLALILPPGWCAGEGRVSLVEAVRIALQDNHEIKAFKGSLDAQKAEIGVVRSFLLPRITLEERAARTNNPPNAFMMKLNQQRFSQSDFAIDSLNNPRTTTDYQSQISFEQPLFVAKSFIGLNMAKKEYSAKQEEFWRKKEEITLRVAQAYLRIGTAKAYVKVSQRGVEDVKEHLRIAEARFQAGLGLYSDFLRASTAVTEAEQKLVGAEKELSVAKRWLGLLLGLSEPVDVLEEDVNLPLMTMEYYEAASWSRRDIRALEMRHENAKTNVRRTESMYLPMFGIGGAYQVNDHDRPFGSEGESWQLTAFLRWELFDGANRGFERQKARHKVAEAAGHLSGLKQFVSFKLHETYLAVEEAKKNVELSRAALKTAEEGRRLVKVRFENSLSPIVDLMDVQLNLDRARANLLARENDYRLAILTLTYESGTIMSDLKIE
jgi:outer membrane protein